MMLSLMGPGCMQRGRTCSIDGVVYHSHIRLTGKSDGMGALGDKSQGVMIFDI